MTDSLATYVGIGVRIVPAGVRVVRGVRVLQASLLLSPIKAEPVVGACGKQIDLRHWPRDVEELLAGADTDALSATGLSNVAIAFSPVTAGEAASKPVLTAKTLSAWRAMFHQQTHAPSFATWQSQRRDDVKDIDARWQELLAPQGDSDWTALLAGLAGASVVERVKNLSPTKDAPPPAAAGAPAPPKPDLVPDVRGVGRGQAALLLSLERGRSLLMRSQVFARGDTGSDRSDEGSLAAAPVPGLPVKGGVELAEKLDKLRSDREQAAAAVRTAAATAQQQQIKASLDAVASETKASARAKRYKDLMACLPAEGVAACLKKAQAADPAALSDAIDASLDRHQDSIGPFSENNPPSPDKLTDPDALEKAFKQRQQEKGPQTRLRTLQSQPSLARLFNLVVDLLIPFQEFEASAKGATPFVERKGLDGESRFGFLSAALTCREAARRVWTASKVRLSQDGFEPDVWTCTRAEVDLFAGLSGSAADRIERDGLIAAGALSQMDGVVNLAARRTTGGEVEPRFDITSLDAFQAVESRATSRLAKPGLVDLVTLRTVGLALIDRWREQSALMQALASLSRETAPIVIDADDLTVGYRMDVGVEHAGALAWRSLCNRSIRFGDANGRIEALLQRVVPDHTDRLMFDAGSVVMPAKLVKQYGDRSNAHVEDTVGVWTGPPVGVDANSQTIALSDNAAALQLAHVYSLGPGPGIKTPPDWLIPRQIFGGGYHFGLTPRLSGGLARPLAAGTIYGKTRAKPGSPPPRELDFGILPTRAEGPRRFLRHERIEAPLIATPLPILARTFDDTADGLRETSTDVVVRSKRGANDYFDAIDTSKGGRVQASYRVVVPPSVSAIFVDRHGFFSDVNAASKLVPYRGHGSYRWMGPRDGLRNVDYDQEAGGFPVYGHSQSSDGDIELAQGDFARPSGDAIFRPGLVSSTPRRDPYYPDPAASFVVVAVRDRAGRQLAGKPLVVPIRPKGVAYPDVRPVALEMRALRTRSGRPPTQERILGLHTADGRLLRGAEILEKKHRETAIAKLDGGDAITGLASGVPATRVDVALEPGESFEIDLWCLPKEEDLARWFDVVETASLIAALDADGNACSHCTDFEARLDALDLGTLLSNVDRLARSRDANICVSGSVALPRGAVRCMAQVAHKLLQARPTPEIAARATVTATHAIAQPYVKPALEVTLQRVMSAPAAADANKDPAPAAAAADKDQDAKVAAADKDRAPKPAVVIAGTISVDRPTTGSFELRAKGASLVSSAFDDDARRRRTPDEFARGLWPRSPVTGDRSKVVDVYGFEVDCVGRVTLLQEEATLLRIDDDVAEANDANVGMVSRDLATLQAAAAPPPVPHTAKAAASPPGAPAPAAGPAPAAAPAPAGPVVGPAPAPGIAPTPAAAPSPANEGSTQGGNKVAVDRPFQITDTRARVLKLTAVAGSRTLWCFRDANGDALASAAAGLVSDEQTLVLAAAKAPAKVSPLTILPAFALNDLGPRRRGTVSTFAAERKVRLRIRLRRPWFSSGEGERLGIVLWPPDILKNRIAPSGATVTRDYDVSRDEKADISMHAFADEDLGPGGPFATRWGLDPIKGSQDQISWLIPKSAFPDLQTAKTYESVGCNHVPLCDEPLYVPRASVPIPVDDVSKSDTRVRLEAALLTYVPRFDIDHEAWFCDVELIPGSAPEPFVRLGLVRYQPYAPLDLQVSEPVAEWVQIPQRRSVCVTIDEKKPNLLNVVVEGTGRTFGNAAAAGFDASKLESWTQRPIMKVSVLRRREDGIEDVAELAEGASADGGSAGFSSRAERTWVPQTQQQWTQALTLPQSPDDAALRPQFAIQPDSPTESGAPLVWTARFSLTDNPLKPKANGSTYSVFVEEIEAMLPATYADEPIDHGKADDARVEIAFSGPRFAARLDIAPSK